MSQCFHESGMLTQGETVKTIYEPDEGLMKNAVRKLKEDAGRQRAAHDSA
jgi:hypothetical protein